MLLHTQTENSIIYQTLIMVGLSLISIEKDKLVEKEQKINHMVGIQYSP